MLSRKYKTKSLGFLREAPFSSASSTGSSSQAEGCCVCYSYLLHGARSFLRSWPVFAASQEIPSIFMEPESSLPYSQVPSIHPYPEPTPSSPHDSLQLPEDPS